jgi:hypothetical protein
LGYSGTFPQPIGPVGSQYYQIYVCPGAVGGTTSPSAPCTATATLSTGTSFVVAAIPVAGTSQAKDTPCQYFAVDNTGTQFSTDTAAGTGGTTTTATCWQ